MKFFALQLFLYALSCALAFQAVFTPHNSWNYSTKGISAAQLEQQPQHSADVGEKILLSSRWRVIGPFPSGMREHQLGAFPALSLHSLKALFDLSERIQVPSAYGRSGQVSVKEVQSRNLRGDGSVPSTRAWQDISISYPDLDFSLVRHSVGWSGVQWQALATTNLTVTGSESVLVSVSLLNGAEFAIITEADYQNSNWHELGAHIKWYHGDWYAYSREAVGNDSEVPTHIIELEAGSYQLVVKAVYEVRIFGDKKGQTPTLDYSVDVRILVPNEDRCLQVIDFEHFAVLPDVVDGIVAGWGLSFAFRNDWATGVQITKVEVVGDARKYLHSSFSYHPLRVAPFQIRQVKLQVCNLMPLPAHITSLSVEITVRQDANGPDKRPGTRVMKIKLPLRHSSLFAQREAKDDIATYVYTYLDIDGTVQIAVAIPPKNIRGHGKHPPLLYLHGAGVDIRDETARKGIARQNFSWVIQPSGRTPWGYDWQGLSHLSAKAALDEFAANLYGMSKAIQSRAAAIDLSKVMVLGHSNGGQGVYHYASHRMDQIIGAVAGAGYISLPEYVPLHWQQGRHFNDAALSGILQSSLDAFKNDLFASNMAGLPFLVKYGSDDDNVPTWHSKEMANLIEFWNMQSTTKEQLVMQSEVPGRGHHWPEFMLEADVQNLIEASTSPKSKAGYIMSAPLKSFTLSVLNPEDFGSKQGWRITQVEIPGRVAQLEVEYTDSLRRMVRVKTSRVKMITIERKEASFSPVEINIDNTILYLNVSADFPGRALPPLVLVKSVRGWVIGGSDPTSQRSLGPMIRFLISSGPVHIIVPTNCADELTEQYLSIARRFSTDAFLYGRLDTVILYDREILGPKKQPRLQTTSNVLLLGGPNENDVTHLATQSQHLIEFKGNSSQFAIRDRTYSSGSTILALLPHPFEDSGSATRDQRTRPMTLLLHGTDPGAIELGYRLLPLRTGALLPEWLVVDRSSVWKGYGGVVGAGWYNDSWGWSEAMSYLI